MHVYQVCNLRILQGEENMCDRVALRSQPRKGDEPTATLKDENSQILRSIA